VAETYKMSNEIKVGVLVFASLILLTILVFVVGEIHIFDRGDRYDVVFDSSAGLMEGAPVRIGGVKVGSVRSIGFIDFKGKRRVKVTVQARSGVVFHAEDQFKISMLGLLGDNYVEVEPGPSSAAIVKPGSTVVGAEVVGMSEMLKMAQDSLGALKRTLDEPTVASFKKAVKNTEDLSGDLAFILATSKDDITVSANNLRTSSERLDRMLARNEDGFNTTMDNLTVMSSDARSTASSLKTISGRLERGEGTAGKLLTEDELYDEALSTTTEAKSLVQDIKERPQRYIHFSIF
jgi:phospholipid/cholesterol/gamma-HCH transport system substrate-binding protein